jgi:hypothetical protein
MSALILLRSIAILVTIIICRNLTETNLYRNGLRQVHFCAKYAILLHVNANIVMTMT